MCYLNRFGPWEVGQVDPTKDNIFDPDFALCIFAVNIKFAINKYKFIYNMKYSAKTFDFSHCSTI